MEKGPARLPCDEKDDEEIPRRPLVTFVRYQDEVSGGGVCTWGGGGELWAAPQLANAAVAATPIASTTITAAISLSIAPPFPRVRAFLGSLSSRPRNFLPKGAPEMRNLCGGTRHAKNRPSSHEPR